MLLSSSHLSFAAHELDEQDLQFDMHSPKPQIRHYDKLHAGSMMAKVMKFRDATDDSIQRRLVAYDLDPILPPYHVNVEELVLKPSEYMQKILSKGEDITEMKEEISYEEETSDEVVSVDYGDENLAEKESESVQQIVPEDQSEKGEGKDEKNVEDEPRVELMGQDKNEEAANEDFIVEAEPPQVTESRTESNIEYDHHVPEIINEEEGQDLSPDKSVLGKDESIVVPEAGIGEVAIEEDPVIEEDMDATNENMNTEKIVDEDTTPQKQSEENMRKERPTEELTNIVHVQVEQQEKNDTETSPSIGVTIDVSSEDENLVSGGDTVASEKKNENEISADENEDSVDMKVEDAIEDIIIPKEADTTILYGETTTESDPVSEADPSIDERETISDSSILADNDSQIDDTLDESTEPIQSADSDVSDETDQTEGNDMIENRNIDESESDEKAEKLTLESEDTDAPAGEDPEAISGNEGSINTDENISVSGVNNSSLNEEVLSRMTGEDGIPIVESDVNIIVDDVPIEIGTNGGKDGSDLNQTENISVSTPVNIEKEIGDVFEERSSDLDIDSLASEPKETDPASPIISDEDVSIDQTENHNDIDHTPVDADVTTDGDVTSVESSLKDELLIRESQIKSPPDEIEVVDTPIQEIDNDMHVEAGNIEVNEEVLEENHENHVEQIEGENEIKADYVDSEEDGPTTNENEANEYVVSEHPQEEEKKEEEHEIKADNVDSAEDDPTSDEHETNEYVVSEHPQEDEKEEEVVQETPPKPSANDEFINGLDDLHKFLEEVDVPDELDVGATGLSLQEVLMGQGAQIVKTRVRKGVQQVRKSFKSFRTNGARKWNGFKEKLDDHFDIDVDGISMSVAEKVEEPLQNVKKGLSKHKDKVDAIKEKTGHSLKGLITKAKDAANNLGLLDEEEDDDELMMFDELMAADDNMAELRKKLMERYQ